MGQPTDTAIWTLDLTIYHSPGYGHKLKARTLGRRGGWIDVGSWPWKGIGFPAELLPDIHARVIATIDEFITTVYGVRGEIPNLWTGDKEPF